GLGTTEEEGVVVADVLGSSAPYTIALKSALAKGHSDNSTIHSAGVNNPHGVFFDFNSHLTPRVWFVHRGTQDGVNAGMRAESGPARLSYFDVVANEMVIYDFGQQEMKDLLGTAPTNLHAAFVDTRGHLWVIS